MRATICTQCRIHNK